MNKSRFTEEQIVAVLREAEAGESVQDLCRRHEISETTFYNWRSKYKDVASAQSERVKQLEEENRRLRSIVAELTLRNQALKRVVSKKW